MKTTDFKFSKEDLILYILNRIEPKKSDLLRLNKVSFFTEFGYLHKSNNELSEVEYAAIDRGPVIDNYKKILKVMQDKGQVKLDDYFVRPLTSPSQEPPEEIKLAIDPLISKYANLSKSELISLSHDTDSYLITTRNEREMGKIIDKKLSSLESFFDDPSEEDIKLVQLDPISEKDLVPYEFG